MENSNYNIVKESPRDLPGSFWGITTFFNSEKYKNKIINYRVFRERSKKQGLKLLMVECAFGNNPFELNKADADILIQVRSNSVLWQKERLLNIGLKNLPSDCDKIAWLDADIIFTDDNWIEESSRLLEKYSVVQLFEYVIRASEKDSKALIKNKDISLDLGLDEKELLKKMSCIKHTIYNNDLTAMGFNPGLAWASRRDVFTEDGFFDKMIVGSGDKIMKYAFINQKLESNLEVILSEKIKESISRWSENIYSKVQASIYYVPGIIVHLYHGKKEKRLLFKRHELMHEYNFDPNLDLKLNEDECFEWASDKKDLHDFVKLYFNKRGETDSLFKGLVYFLKNIDKIKTNLYISKKLKFLKKYSLSIILKTKGKSRKKSYKAIIKPNKHAKRKNNNKISSNTGYFLKLFYRVKKRIIRLFKKYISYKYFFLIFDSIAGKFGLLIKKLSPSTHKKIKELFFAVILYKQQFLNKNFRKVAKIDKLRILKAANIFIKEDPVTITSFSSPRSCGGKHDFFSEGDYWWANPENPDGPYVRRDGVINPNNFVEHRRAMTKFSIRVSTLTAAYLVSKKIIYLEKAKNHLLAWFVNDETKMNPSLSFAQATKGTTTGRSFGIIDSIHLVEVAKSILIIERIKIFTLVELETIKKWFEDYLVWLTTSAYGTKEMSAKNNHGTCWVLQVAMYSDLLGKKNNLNLCRNIFKETLLPKQLATNGSFPLELARTNPYNYSLFNLDIMMTLCHVLLNESENLFEFTLEDGRNIKQAIQFMYPYIADKSTWKYAPDIIDYGTMPNRQVSLLFSSIAYKEEEYFKLWRTLNPDPNNEEAIRNFPIRQPILWVVK
ncbi:MAG: alginate lyase family protein [Patescibacteria group bacterium]